MRKRERVYFLKDEVGGENNYHIHALVDLYYLKKRSLPPEWFLQQVNNYWSTSIQSYTRDKSWKQLHENVKEPRCGWFKDVRPEFNSRTMSNNRLSLFHYQTKTVKPLYDKQNNYLGNSIVSNCQYHASYGLYNSLEKLHNRYGTENRYLKRKSDALI